MYLGRSFFPKLCNGKISFLFMLSLDVFIIQLKLQQNFNKLPHLFEGQVLNFLDIFIYLKKSKRTRAGGEKIGSGLSFFSFQS